MKVKLSGAQGVCILGTTDRTDHRVREKKVVQPSGPQPNPSNNPLFPVGLLSPTYLYRVQMLQMSAVETGQMSSVETGKMIAVETGQISAVETRQMSSAVTRQMSTGKTGRCPVSLFYICLVSAGGICLVSTADICPVSTADICLAPTEDIRSVSTAHISFARPRESTQMNPTAISERLGPVPWPNTCKKAVI